MLDEGAAGSDLGEDEAMRMLPKRSVGFGAGDGPRGPEPFGCGLCSTPMCWSRQRSPGSFAQNRAGLAAG